MLDQLVEEPAFLPMLQEPLPKGGQIREVKALVLRQMAGLPKAVHASESGLPLRCLLDRLPQTLCAL
ncbi:MAG: hypothetical protein FJZ90_05855 [Chloroflexi bacterium]|nr:hypothetical protein [Chloroflexota bacterium]